MSAHGLLLVGYGRRGQQWATELGRSKRVALAGVVEPHEPGRATAAGAGAPVWAELGEALSATDASTALIAAPAEAHRDLAERCLGAGLAVLIEKPVALSTVDAVAIESAAVSADRPALVAQNFRHRRWARAVEEAVREGPVGHPREVVITTVRPASAAPAAIRDETCGALWDLGIHHLDRYRRLLGGLPGAVTGRVEATADATRTMVEATWGDGSRLTYHQTDGAPGHSHQEIVLGDDAMLRVNDERVDLLSTRHRPRRLRGPRRSRPEQWLLDQLATAVDGGATADSTVTENLSTIALLEAAATAVATGDAVDPAALLARARPPDPGPR